MRQMGVRMGCSAQIATKSPNLRAEMSPNGPRAIINAQVFVRLEERRAYSSK